MQYSPRTSSYTFRIPLFQEELWVTSTANYALVQLSLLKAATDAWPPC